MIFIDPLSLATTGKVSTSNSFLNFYSLATLGILLDEENYISYRLCLYLLTLNTSPTITETLYLKPSVDISLYISPVLENNLYLPPSINTIIKKIPDLLCQLYLNPVITTEVEICD